MEITTWLRYKKKHKCGNVLKHLESVISQSSGTKRFYHYVIKHRKRKFVRLATELMMQNTSTKHHQESVYFKYIGTYLWPPIGIPLLPVALSHCQLCRRKSRRRIGLNWWSEENRRAICDACSLKLQSADINPRLLSKFNVRCINFQTRNWLL